MLVGEAWLLFSGGDVEQVHGLWVTPTLPGVKAGAVSWYPVIQVVKIDLPSACCGRA